MNCMFCKHGATSLGGVTVMLERGGTVVIVKDVPAHVCDNCGEYYLDEDVSERLFCQAEEAVARHAEVEILRCAA